MKFINAFYHFDKLKVIIFRFFRNHDWAIICKQVQNSVTAQLFQIIVDFINQTPTFYYFVAIVWN